ncbi:hypothetical protein QZH41_006845 [Actinostola sp. cb2023]|nr:hypothetical protein QZH41_006845 [Actinostola sp. cb2023]
MPGKRGKRKAANVRESVEKELQKKIIIRDSHRTFTEKLVEKAKEYLANKESAKVKLLQAKSSVQEKIDCLKELDDKILSMTSEKDDEDLEEELETSGRLRMEMQELILELEELTGANGVYEELG